MAGDPGERDGSFGTRRFRDTSRSQYNHALKHFVPFVKQSQKSTDDLIVFLDAAGTARDDTFRAFAAYLNAREDMTEAVFRNCVKWMQKNLEWQCEQRSLPPPKAYVTRLPGMKEICAAQREKQQAREAISRAKDAALLARMDPRHRPGGSAQTSTAGPIAGPHFII
mmetsp:Transcript_22740/g.70325  ORF Transcript_22740/g.70325 Transcript_22740/m.70325 type:complete len:167 (+) Transcript_22740:260-760(+)